MAEESIARTTVHKLASGHQGLLAAAVALGTTDVRGVQPKDLTPILEGSVTVELTKISPFYKKTRNGRQPT